jgi:hypothetical protein
MSLQRQFLSLCSLHLQFRIPGTRDVHLDLMPDSLFRDRFLLLICALLAFSHGQRRHTGNTPQLQGSTTMLGTITIVAFSLYWLSRVSTGVWNLAPFVLPSFNRLLFHGLFVGSAGAGPRDQFVGGLVP